MPIIHKAIEGSAYNTLVPVIGFRYKDWRVIVHSREIHVKEIEKEEDAIEAVNYINHLISNAESISEKIRT